MDRTDYQLVDGHGDYHEDSSGLDGFAIARAASSEADARLILPAVASIAQGHRRQAAKVQPDASRVLDIVLSATLIVVLLPVLALIALAVRLTSRGDALFVHQRVGAGGRPFGCYKFRSMRHNADQLLTEILRDRPDLRREWLETRKLPVDPRITSLGRFLRSTSLDELPQLFNVLRGDMAMVGPRPIVSEELAHYGRFASSYFGVRPGLTGLWQVTGRSGTSYRRRVATDHFYYRNRSLAMDLRIMFATIPAVLLQRGAC